MFTFVDAIVVVVLLISAGLAFRRGFVHEVLAIGAWVGAVLAAFYGLPYLQPWFRAQIGTLWIADSLAGLSLFLGTLVILSLLTKAIANRVRKSALGSVDSSLGVLFGMLRGWVILCLVFMLVSWATGPGKPPVWLERAHSRPWLQRSATLMEQMWPRNFGAKGTARTAVQPIRNSFETVLKEATGAATGAAPVRTADNNTGNSGSPAPSPKGYNRTQRTEMDRLIETHQ
jgi:membrane protein required for colicin V production